MDKLRGQANASSRSSIFNRCAADPRRPGDGGMQAIFNSGITGYCEDNRVYFPTPRRVERGERAIQTEATHDAIHCVDDCEYYISCQLSMTGAITEADMCCLHWWTLQALQSDFSCVHVLQGRAKPKLRTHSGGILVNNTIFGRRYLAVAIDEAHGFRNVNRLYGAVRALRDKCDILVAMTATPVQSRPAVSAQGIMYT